MLAFGLRKRINGLTLRGLAGLGRQRIDQEPGTTTQLLEFAATSPVNSNSYYFKTQLGYGKSAGFSGAELQLWLYKGAGDFSILNLN